MKKLIIPLLLLLTITGCGKKQATKPVSVPQPVTQIVGLGKIMPVGGVSELASPVSGIITGIPVKEGSKVKKGDILVQLDNKSQQLDVAEAENKMMSQQKAIESARLLLNQKSIALEDKLRKLTDAGELLKAGAATGDNVRMLQNDYDQGVQEVKKLQSDLALQESQLNELSVQKEIKINTLSQTTLRAPMDGTVLDILPRTGESVSQYQTYGRLAPDAPMIVQAEIDEMFSDKLEQGQSCSVRLLGESQPVASGKIISVSADLKKKSLFSDSGEDMQDRRVREIEISLDEVSKPLLINTKVECTVMTK
ncbi:MAG TPA: HlyD family efflux transporter periplasmic adaptor subunit [Bacteroidales bacterium]|nr:HlyD family efflux transporter periplasmic adaptor subunit [Bacteroidales bacterium]HPT10995.1 HlyD family efflux transporter periplasmic adaptor subunit [Bacteroidales bacterium]